MTLPFQIVPFSREYDRTSFCSSSVQLNQYLQKQVSQDIKRKLASCYLMVTPDKQIVGFYTLSSYVVEFCELSAKHQKNLQLV
ncbi:Uncharacterised protein [Moraxella caprae]|uniref:Uncharacterized protein n=1 Tax=Moraxella caprae TaxID=90240 RepID=A0A378R1S2_9GAMM|nr:hypothetical protein [Moraxella caprae]STZ09165.1 Uncharacterised protein [Moraxella caprae]